METRLSRCERGIRSVRNGKAAVLASKREARAQIAALPIRIGRSKKIEVLLITSRETGRWVVCKGWPMDGLKDHEAARQEAREEAGVEGRIQSAPLGAFFYWKRLSECFQLCEVSVYVLVVKRHLRQWREKGQRRLCWFSVAEAAELVDEPGLADVIRSLEDADPRFGAA